MSVTSTLRRRFTAALSGAAALAAAVLAAPAAHAVTPFSGPVPLFASSCTQGSGDASSSVNGTTRGAVTCAGEEDGRISAFWVQGTVRTTRSSPWTGQVLATSWDQQSRLWVLFRQGTALRLGSVTDAGAFSAPATLSTSLDAYTPADLVAVNGRWWAVWGEAQGNGVQYDLFQARTLLGTQSRTRITGSAAEDLEPSIAYSLGRVTLVWTRYAPGLASSEVWLGTSTGGTFAAKALAAAGTYDNLPQVAAWSGHTYLSWSRDGVIQYRTDESGSWRGRAFATRGHLSRIAVSNGRVVLAWETEEPVRIYVAEGTGATAFTGATVTGPQVGLVALTSGNGRATLVHRAVSGVVSRFQG